MQLRIQLSLNGGFSRWVLGSSKDGDFIAKQLVPVCEHPFCKKVFWFGLFFFPLFLFIPNSSFPFAFLQLGCVFLFGLLLCTWEDSLSVFLYLLHSFGCHNVTVVVLYVPFCLPALKWWWRFSELMSAQCLKCLRYFINADYLAAVSVILLW